MPNRIIFVDATNQEKIGNLQYGTFITGAPNNPESIYVKVDKRKAGSGINLIFPKGDCVLLNIKTGSLRAVPGESRVTVLSANIELTKQDAEGLKEFRKWAE